MEVIKLTDDQWLEKFKPLCDQDGQPVDQGYDHPALDRMAKERKLWTLIDSDGVLYISEGFHYVNRMEYWFCEVPFGEDEVYEVIWYNPDDEDDIYILKGVNPVCTECGMRDDGAGVNDVCLHCGADAWLEEQDFINPDNPDSLEDARKALNYESIEAMEADFMDESNDMLDGTNQFTR